MTNDNEVTETPEGALYLHRLVEVPSSKKGAAPYLVRVRISAKASYCQCRGFAYRQNCRHLKEALIAITEIGTELPE